MTGFTRTVPTASNSFPTQGASRGKGSRSVAAYFRLDIALNQGDFRIGQIPLFGDRELHAFIIDNSDSLDQANWEFELNMTSEADLSSLSFDTSVVAAPLTTGQGYLNVYVSTSEGRLQVGGIKLEPEKAVHTFLMQNEDKLHKANWVVDCYVLNKKKAPLSFA